MLALTQIFGGKVLKRTGLHTDYYLHKIVPYKIIAIKSILVAENTKYIFRKRIVQILFSQVYINSEWLLNINYKSIPTLSHGFRGGKDSSSSSSGIQPQSLLTIIVGFF